MWREECWKARMEEWRKVDSVGRNMVGVRRPASATWWWKGSVQRTLSRSSVRTVRSSFDSPLLPTSVSDDPEGTTWATSTVKPDGSRQLVTTASPMRARSRSASSTVSRLRSRFPRFGRRIWQDGAWAAVSSRWQVFQTMGEATSEQTAQPSERGKHRAGPRLTSDTSDFPAL